MSHQAGRQCRECGEYFPETADHFKKRRDGRLDTCCLVCRRSISRGRKKKEAEKTLVDIEQGAVNTFLKNATTGARTSRTALRCWSG